MKKYLITLVAVAISAIAVSSPVRSMLASNGSELMYSDEMPPPLPDGVVAVEYLESTGTQWIDTKVVPSSGIVFAVEMSTSTTTTSRLNGVFISDNSRRLMVGVSQYNKIQFGCDALYTTAIDNDGLRHRLEVDTVDLVCRIDGSSVMSISTSPRFPGLSIYLFARHRNNNQGVDYNLAGRIYRSQIAIKGTLIRDFTPVRFTNEQNQTEGAMYDFVSGELFRNQGTGSFIVGPDKEDYQ